MFRRCVLPFLLLLNLVLATPPSRESYPDQLADGLSSPPVVDTREVRGRSLLRMAEAAMAYKEVPSSQDPTEEEEEGTVVPSPEKVIEMLESEGKDLTPADQLDLEFRVNLGLAAREGKHGMAFLQSKLVQDLAAKAARLIGALEKDLEASEDGNVGEKEMPEFMPHCAQTMEEKFLEAQAQGELTDSEHSLRFNAQVDCVLRLLAIASCSTPGVSEDADAATTPGEQTTCAMFYAPPPPSAVRKFNVASVFNVISQTFDAKRLVLRMDRTQKLLGKKKVSDESGEGVNPGSGSPSSTDNHGKDAGSNVNQNYRNSKERPSVASHEKEKWTHGDDGGDGHDASGASYRRRRDTGLLSPSPDEDRVSFLDKAVEVFTDTTKFVEGKLNEFGGNLNRNIDIIHDTDHGVRICNQDEEFENGVCFSQSKCDILGGERVDFCRIFTPKTTCCKFERKCRGESEQTVTYFKSSGNLDFPSGCELILTSRLGACQIRLDFLELELPPPDRFGQCAKETAMEIQMLGRDPIFLCGTNSGNHWYFPVLERGSNLLIKGPAGKHFKWNVKVTQIDCRSGVPSMRALRAPDGCSQYFTKEKGALASLNFDGESAIMANQDYSICFKSSPDLCELRLTSQTFNLPRSDGCGKTHVSVPGAQDDQGTPLPSDKFCGNGFGAGATGMVSSKNQPFVVRVKSGPESTEDSNGFLFLYDLLKC